ncbi:MAG: hypothetical protein ACJ72N_05105 [Labedaea sp.]
MGTGDTVDTGEFRWQYADGLGCDVPGPELTFADRNTAEEWLSANWPDLLDGGIEEVTLLRSAEVIYGPMGLNPTSG